MDTFRKWWNKPKADDKSILARFYYADRALTAVASELDSFDGRAEPERCSRLVGRLRQGQDQVLAITNIIMDELLGDDRAPRAFRAKFPEEVLQESLAGQLWFGAECLAAGSSIMNRESESASMRPLAKAVTKSLDHVRNLLREQCLRNKTPNSLTLNLDLNDACTETLCESLKIFDRLFAEFEFLYVSAMVQVKTKQEHEMQELICVLFSETLQRALRLGLLEQDQVDYYDPALMFSIPRLAIVAGLVIYPRGPLNMSMPAEQLSEMFRPFRTLLIKIRDLLRTLNSNELYQLEKLLCTNEDIHIIQEKEMKIEEKPILPTSESTTSFNCDDNEHEDDGDEGDNDDEDEDDDNINNDNKVNRISSASSSSSIISRSSSSTSNNSNSSNVVKISCSGSSSTISTNSDSELDKNVINHGNNYSIVNINSDRHSDNLNEIPNNYYNESETMSDATPTSSLPLSPQLNVWTNTPIAPSTTGVTTRFMVGSPVQPASPDDTLKEGVSLVTSDCASGYLIPNTNFGNLLQTTDTPLTDSFISSDDEYTTKFDQTITNDDEDGDDSSAALSAIASVVVSGDISGMVNLGNVGCNTNTIDDFQACSSNLNQIQSLCEENDNKTVAHHSRHMVKEADSGIGTAENTSLDHTPDSETNNLIGETTNTAPTIIDEKQQVEDMKRLLPTEVHSIILPVLAANTVDSPTMDYSNGNDCSDDEQRDLKSNNNNETQRRHSSHSHHGHHHHHNRTHQKEKCDKRNCSKHKHHSQEKQRSNSSASYTNAEDAKHNANNSSSKTVHLRRKSSRSSSDRGTGDVISTSSTSSMYSDGELKEVSLAIRTAGRMKFKSTENLLHRLFVCIAGVADQLQTNFASDLRQILRSVFLMNTTPSPEETDLKISEKSKDSTADLFEFRASENDVIQENDGGSNQSIYSAEEASPETDSVFEQSTGQPSPNVSLDRQERSSSLETEIRITTNRSNVERSRSLGEENTIHSRPVSVVVTTTSNNCHHQCENINNVGNNKRSNSVKEHNQSKDYRNSIKSGSSSPTNVNQHRQSGENSPTISTTTTTIILTTNSHLHRHPINESHHNQQRIQQPNHQQQPQTQNYSSSVPRQQQIMMEVPPRWIPDEEAAQCMACSQSFTTFRRRHHCRNCGGVFCGVCSNTQAPLPKFGLNKAVRVCRNCFLLSISNNTGTTNTSTPNNNNNSTTT